MAGQSDRVMVLPARPALIEASFAVPQPQPRKLSSPAYSCAGPARDSVMMAA
jgi:hypothetical protein